MTTTHLRPVGPASPHVPDAVGQIRRLMGVVESSAARVRTVRDPEAIHDLRVASRRLGSALATWSDALDPIARRRAERGVTRLRRQLSRAREREVLAEHFAELIAEESLTVREAGVSELERLDRRVALARARGARTARRRRIARLVLKIEACAATFSGVTPAVLASVRAQSEARRAAAVDAIALSAEGDDAALHRARIAVKRWRYHLEAMASAPGNQSSERLAGLRDLQQCLGAIHDAAVLRDFISGRALKARAKGRDARHDALVSLREKSVRARLRALERLTGAVAAAGVTRLS